MTGSLGGGEQLRGAGFYDQPLVFEQYLDHRHGGVSSPNMTLEEPALLDELGGVAGLRVVDLGCGDATFGRVLLQSGCRSYLGVDGSARMVHAARETLRGTDGEVIRRNIEDFAAGAASVDVVVSRLAFHYVADLCHVLASCRRWLVPRGRLVFTVVHPVITSHDARDSTEERRTNWVVDDYFVAGERVRSWLGGTVVWHHRTIEDYVQAVLGAGFRLTALRECPPQAERFEGDTAELERRRRVPLFLLLAGVPTDD